ncbi:LysE family translocator [Formosa sp. PL04]|uniref:LysE family translocator n=1 Tax=Formosa sp. PL04 TaxID=3081755 RepID=UPI0029819DBE|nr:LysE family translocator [Formosa sp. PL04]MDW5290706.1 LysE family translocator [Formosa sp. PL04]
MGIQNFITFILTALVFVMTPGIDTVFVLNKSIGQGRKSGVYASLGINTGVLAHTFFAALGLTVLLSKSAMALIILKYVGFFYLMYIGVSKLKNSNAVLAVIAEPNTAKKGKSDFWSGFFTNILNPKVALFFLAFFPQFINPTHIENPIPFILLGLTFALLGTVWYIGLTYFASNFTEKINSNPNFNVWLNRLSGFAFILMGITIVLN